jgi:hypothetical protein
MQLEVIIGVDRRENADRFMLLYNSFYDVMR